MRYVIYMASTGRARPRKARQLEFEFRTRGGRRQGAGRKPNGAKAGVPHLRRPELNPRHPLHVTMRLCRGLPSLRQQRLAGPVFEAFRAAKVRFGVRLVQFSLQSNHLHLLVEAPGRQQLSRAMQGLGVRIARRVNDQNRRRGSVFADRYHARVLATPLEVRRALIYVLHNHRRHHHGAGRPAPIDPFSSAPYFDGFFGLPIAKPRSPPPVAWAQTWLLRAGWLLLGWLTPRDVPDASS